MPRLDRPLEIIWLNQPILQMKEIKPREGNTPAESHTAIWSDSLLTGQTLNLGWETGSFFLKGRGLRIMSWRDRLSSSTKKLFAGEAPFLLEGSSGLDIFTLTALMMQEKKKNPGKSGGGHKGRRGGWEGVFLALLR